MGNKNYKIVRENKPFKKKYRIGLTDLDEVNQGNYYDLDMWEEKDISKVLKKAEYILKQCESTTNSCKNKIHHITVFSTKIDNERNICVSENGVIFLTTFVSSSIYLLKKRGLYYIWPPKGKLSGITRYYQMMTPHKRPRTKMLVLKCSRNLRDLKYTCILDQFDYVVCTNFGREFVFTT